MWAFGAFCDEFHVSARLCLKLDMDPTRETLLHFFDRIRRSHPTMSRMRRRDEGSLVLDEEFPDTHARRSLRVDRNVLKVSYLTPPSRDAVLEYGQLVFTQAPAHLTLSPIDVDYMEVLFTFDLDYRGNHDELVADTFFADHPLMGLFAGDGLRVIDCQPFLGVALSRDCDRQAYVEIKGRTSTFEVRSGEFDVAPLSVCLTVRQYSGYADFEDLSGTFRDLLLRGEKLATERVVPAVVQPLASAIANQR